MLIFVTNLSILIFRLTYLVTL